MGNKVSFSRVRSGSGGGTLVGGLKGRGSIGGAGGEYSIEWVEK